MDKDCAVELIKKYNYNVDAMAKRYAPQEVWDSIVETAKDEEKNVLYFVKRGEDKEYVFTPYDKPLPQKTALVSLRTLFFADVLNTSCSFTQMISKALGRFVCADVECIIIIGDEGAQSGKYANLKKTFRSSECKDMPLCLFAQNACEQIFGEYVEPLLDEPEAEPIEEEVETLTEESKEEVETPTEESKEEVETPTEEPKVEVATPTEEPKEEVETPIEETKEEVETPIEETKEEVETPIEETKEEAETPTEEPKEEAETPIEETKEEVETPTEEPKVEAETPTEEPKVDEEESKTAPVVEKVEDSIEEGDTPGTVKVKVTAKVISVESDDDDGLDDDATKDEDPVDEINTPWPEDNIEFIPREGYLIQRVPTSKPYYMVDDLNSSAPPFVCKATVLVNRRLARVKPEDHSQDYLFWPDHGMPAGARLPAGITRARYPYYSVDVGRHRVMKTIDELKSGAYLATVEELQSPWTEDNPTGKFKFVAKYKGLIKRNYKKGPGHYTVAERSGGYGYYNKAQLIALGYATEGAVLPQPWDRDNITFIPENIPDNVGKISRDTFKGFGNYEIHFSDGKIKYVTVQDLRDLGYIR